MPVYQEKIVELVQANNQSLEVDFIQLSKHQTALAIWAIDAPSEMFELFSEVAHESVAEKFPQYIKSVHSEIFVRMTGLPVVEPVRNIRCAPAFIWQIPCSEYNSRWHKTLPLTRSRRNSNDVDIVREGGVFACKCGPVPWYASDVQFHI